MIKNLLGNVLAGIIILCSSANANDLKEGNFGDDGFPVNCSDSYYEEQHLRFMCYIAKKENVTASSFFMAAVFVQIIQTAEQCKFDLKDEFVDSMDKMKSEFPRSFELAEQNNMSTDIRSCSESRYYIKDMLK